MPALAAFEKKPTPKLSERPLDVIIPVNLRASGVR
jgi:hypothetical protein